jgi:two-component system sensor histidine kinase KdpD
MASFTRPSLQFLGVNSGRWPAMIAAGLSFLCIDFFYVPPVHTFTIADVPDNLNLTVFIAVGAIVGTFGSRRRASQLRSAQLAEAIREQNVELERLNREQAEGDWLGAAGEGCVDLKRSRGSV